MFLVINKEKRIGRVSEVSDILLLTYPEEYVQLCMSVSVTYRHTLKWIYMKFCP